MSKRLFIVGIDPGMTTGVATLEGSTGVKYSHRGEGAWQVGVEQYRVEDLQKLGEEVAEPAWQGLTGIGSELAWWNSMAQAGTGLAMKVLDLLSAGMGGLSNATSGHGDLEGEPVTGVVVVEDFMLRPNDRGIGGRNVLSPVAITAAFLALWQQLSGVQVIISGTGNKSMMDDAKIKRWFPSGGGAKGTVWVGSGKRHGTDALRHALMGVRMVK